jgi:hypothetical protein
LLSHIIRNNNRWSEFIRDNDPAFQTPIATKVAPAASMPEHPGFMFPQGDAFQDPVYKD